MRTRPTRVPDPARAGRAGRSQVSLRPEVVSALRERAEAAGVSAPVLLERILLGADEALKLPPR